MKISFVFLCTCVIFSIKKTRGSAIGAPFYPLNPEDLSEGDIKELEYWDKYYHRPKRTIAPVLGSAALIIKLKTALISGTKMKIIEVARGSILGTSTGVKHTAAQAVGGTVAGSTGAIHQLKAALGAEAHKKIGQVAKASAGVLTGALSASSSGAGNIGKSAFGSASAIKQLKSAALSGLTKKIGAVAAGSAKNVAHLSASSSQVATGAIGASANAVKQLKTAALSAIGNKIGQIASGSAKGAGQASAGVISASSNTLNSLKSALISGLTSKAGHIAKGSAGALATASSAGAGTIAGSLVESANAIHQLKLVALAGIKQKIGQIASGSAGVVTGASKGLHTKVKEVSGDIVTGGVDVANQLKSAVSAGIKNKLGQAASGLAGAITGAVGSASAGLGQITRGIITESTNLFSLLKASFLKETQRKIGQVARASTGASGHFSEKAGSAIQGSSEALFQLKHALVSGLKNQLGQLAAGSAAVVTGSSAAVSGSAEAIKMLKSAALTHITNKIGQVARGSVSVATAASGQASRLSGGAIFGSANAVKQLKAAIVSQIAGKIGQAAHGSVSVAIGASGQASGATISGSVNAINQLKSAALSHITNKIGQVARGSVSASGQASKASGAAVAGSVNTVHKLKAAAVSHLANKIGQIGTTVVGASGHFSQGSTSAIIGSAKAVHNLKAAAVSSVHNKLKQAASGIVNASSDFEDGVAAGVSGSAKGIHQLKEAAVEKVQNQISNLAEASAGRRKRSVHVDGFPSDMLQNSFGEVDVDLPKRSEPSASGSADIVNQLKAAVVSGLTKKIGQVAKGSAGALAGASAGFSKGSSGDAKGYSYGAPPVDDHKSLNLWDLKKSVLNTLLQAVKAIKGGVLAIKGQLIKGSGFIVSGGGKLIAASGDKVTQLGKNIINNAVLVPPKKGHHYVHSEYGPPSASYTAPSGPPVAYEASLPASAPSGHAYESHYESHHYDSPHERPYGTHAGILILRRMPSSRDKYHSSHSHTEESVVPPFKPLTPTGPTLNTVVGKFFTASTSLNPSEPTPFTDTDLHTAHFHDGPIHYKAESTRIEEPRHHYEPPPVSYQSPLIKEHKPTLSNTDFRISAPSAPSYESPSEYQSITDHFGAQASSVNEQTVKLTKGELIDHLEGAAPLASSEVQLAKDAPESLQALKNSLHLKGHTLGPPFNSDYLPNKASPPTNHLRSPLLPSPGASSKYNNNYSRLKKTTSKESFSQKLEPNDLLANFLPKEDPSYSSASRKVSNELSSKENYMKVLENFPPPRASKSYHQAQRLKTMRVQSDRLRKPSNRPDFSVVKSVAYELTPDGAKRLT